MIANRERVVYGVHAVTELLRARREQVSAVLVQEGGEEDGGAEIRNLCREARRLGLGPVERARGELDRLARGGVHQGVLALCGEYPYADVPAILGRAQESGTAPLLLLLDGVLDPQNLGALLRSAHVLGAHGAIIPQDRAAQVTPAVVKASAGATELLPVARVQNLVRAMEQLKEAGLWLLATVAGHGEPAPWQLDLKVPLGLVLGSEGRGLRPLVRRTCDLRTAVPMSGGLHGASLNVAAAGAVLLYEVLRQRRSAAV